MTQPPQQPAGGPGYGPPPGPGYGPPPGYPPYGYALRPPGLSLGGAPLADFGTRLLAALIDGAILGAVGLVCAVPLLLAFFAMMRKSIDAIDPVTGQPDPTQFFDGFFLPILLIEFGFFIFILAIYYVYYVEMFYKSGQTVGKRVMKIRVVPMDPAARLTRGMAAARYLVEFVAGMFVPFLPYLDGLWQLWDKPYQQTLHDKAANTVVIKVSV